MKTPVAIMQCGKPSTFFKIPHGGYDLDVVAMAITIVSTPSSYQPGASIVSVSI